MNMFSGMIGQAVRSWYLGPRDPIMFPHLREVLTGFRVSPPRNPDRARERIEALGFKTSINGTTLSIYSYRAVPQETWEEAFNILKNEGVL